MEYVPNMYQFQFLQEETINQFKNEQSKKSHRPRQACYSMPTFSAIVTEGLNRGRRASTACSKDMAGLEETEVSEQKDTFGLLESYSRQGSEPSDEPQTPMEKLIFPIIHADDAETGTPDSRFMVFKLMNALEKKDRELKMAAEIGQMLLQRDEEMKEALADAEDEIRSLWTKNAQLRQENQLLCGENLKMTLQDAARAKHKPDATKEVKLHQIEVAKLQEEIEGLNKALQKLQEELQDAQMELQSSQKVRMEMSRRALRRAQNRSQKLDEYSVACMFDDMTPTASETDSPCNNWNPRSPQSTDSTDGMIHSLMRKAIPRKSFPQGTPPQQAPATQCSPRFGKYPMEAIVEVIHEDVSPSRQWYVPEVTKEGCGSKKLANLRERPPSSMVYEQQEPPIKHSNQVCSDDEDTAHKQYLQSNQDYSSFDETPDRNTTDRAHQDWLQNMYRKIETPAANLKLYVEEVLQLNEQFAQQMELQEAVILALRKQLDEARIMGAPVQRQNSVSSMGSFRNLASEMAAAVNSETTQQASPRLSIDRKSSFSNDNSTHLEAQQAASEFLDGLIYGKSSTPRVLYPKKKSTINVLKDVDQGQVSNTKKEFVARDTEADLEHLRNENRSLQTGVAVLLCKVLEAKGKQLEISDSPGALLLDLYALVDSLLAKETELAATIQKLEAARDALLFELAEVKQTSPHDSEDMEIAKSTWQCFKMCF